MKTPLRSSPLCFLFALTASACGQGALPDDGPPAAAEQALATGGAAGAAPYHRCGYIPPGRRQPRRVVVSHPYDKDGNPATAYEVLSLATDGTLKPTGKTFQLGTMTDGEIVFTPDGRVGLAVQYDGSIGVFRFDDAGAVHVVSAAVTSIAYASRLVMDPSGERVYVLSTQWRESGGGVFSARIACDGTLTSEGLLAASKLPAGLQILPPLHPGQAPRAVAVATDILTSTAGNNFHMLRFGAPPTVLAGVDGFGDEQSIISAVARTPDDRYVLAADNNEFSGIANRIAVVAVLGDTLRPTQVLTPLQDPVALVLSPYGNAGLYVSGYGNAIHRLSYDAHAAAPFADAGELTYVGKRPQLPAAAVLIDHGPLRGRVLVVETEGLRQVAFAADGSVQDLGLSALGSGDIADLVGGLGIAP